MISWALILCSSMRPPSPRPAINHPLVRNGAHPTPHLRRRAGEQTRSTLLLLRSAISVLVLLPATHARLPPLPPLCPAVVVSE